MKKSKSSIRKVASQKTEGGGILNKRFFPDLNHRHEVLHVLAKLLKYKRGKLFGNIRPYKMHDNIK